MGIDNIISYHINRLKFKALKNTYMQSWIERQGR